MQNHNSSPRPAIRRTKKDKSLRDVILILFRNKKPAVATFILILTATLGYVYSSDAVYTSESKVLIQLGRENVAMDPSVTGPTVSLYQHLENEVNSEIAILTSRTILEMVVDKVGPGRILGSQPSSSSPPEALFVSNIKSGIETVMNSLGMADTTVPRDKAIRHVRKGFSVAAEKRSNVIRLSYSDSSPEKARLILGELLTTYLDHHIEVHKTQASPIFFREQTERLENALAANELQLKEFRTKYGVASIKTQKESLQQQLESMQKEQDKAASMVDSSRAKIASIKNALNGKSRIIEISRVTGRQNGAIQGIKAKLMDLRMQEVDLSSRYPDNHRPLQEIRRQIAASEELLRREQKAKANAEVTTGVDMTYQNLQIQLTSTQSELDSNLAMQRALEKAITERKAELQKLLGLELKERELERDTALLQQEYIEYRNNLQQAIRAEQMDRSKVANVSIIQHPSKGMTAVNPQKGPEALIAISLALACALLSAFLFESMNHSFRDSVDVEKNIGMQVLATIPKQKE